MLLVLFKRLFSSWWLSFLLTYSIVLIWKFFGIVLGEAILPGGDTLGHFFAFTEYSKALSQGQLYSYTNAWFGGIPLFQFYSPLLFLVMFFFKILFGWLFTDAIIFRLIVVSSFVWFPLPFYFFLKEFFDKKIAQVGIWLSFLWIFYPKILGSLGIGAGGSIFYGLFNQVLAIGLGLLYFVFLKRLLSNDEEIKKNIFFTGLLFASILLTNLLSAVAIFIFSFLFFIYKKRNLTFINIKKIISVIILFFLFVAWWFIPFLYTFQYQSGNVQAIAIYLPSALIGLFPFDLSQLWRGQFLEFGYVWFVFLGLFIYGFVVLVKKRNTIIPFLFITGFFLLATDFLSSIFPEIPFHYYRFIPFIFVFALAIAAVGLTFFWERICQKWYIAYIFILFCFFMLTQLICGYNLGNGNDFILVSPRLARLNSDIQYYDSLKKYPLHDEAQRLIGDLKQIAYLPFRVLTDMQQIWLMQNLSSMHYFNTLLPLKNNQAVINGLYAESAWQLPFIFPVIGKVTNSNISWGRVEDLSQNNFFINQPLSMMMQRLSLFGVNYFLQNGQPRDDLRYASSTINFLGNTNHFSLYYLSNAKDKVYVPGYKLGVFFQCGEDSDEFRKFSLGWYSVVENLEHPIIDGGSILDSDSEILLNSNQVSYIILQVDKNAEKCLSKMNVVDKPILFLNTSDSYYGITDGEHNRLEIKNFQPIAQYNDRGVWSQPNITGLLEMSEFIMNNTQENQIDGEISVENWENNKISFTGSGPVIVNLSYFPYWQSSSGKVYPVTPGQMLVFADGDVVLEYKGGLDTKIGLGLSFMSYIFVLGYFIKKFIVKKKNNKL